MSEDKKTRKKKGEAPQRPKDLIPGGALPDYGTWFSYKDPSGREYARIHYSKHEHAIPYAHEGDNMWERRPPKKRWPFQIADIGDNPEKWILITHAESCARHAAGVFKHRLSVLAWMGDSHGFSATDWTGLRGRHVLLWPANTNDEKNAVQGLAMHLAHLGVEVYFVRIPEDKPLGWDLTSAIHDAGDQASDQVRHFIKIQMVRYAPDPFQPVDEDREDKQKLDKEFSTEEFSSVLSKTAPGLRQGLNQLNFQTRYNQRGNHHEIRKVTGDGQVWLPWYQRLGLPSGDSGWVQMSEFLEAHLLDQLHASFKAVGSMRPYYLKGDEFKRAFLSIQMDRNVDDFKEWLERGLPTWDGIKRIHALADDILGAYPLDVHEKWMALIEHASMALFLGPIQRTFEPGCELDEMIVLLGPGNRGKTKFYNYLFPEEKEHWYVGPLEFSDTRKEMIEMVEGAVVVEAGEMILTELTKAQRAKMKDFITRQKDKIRAAYGRKAGIAARRFAIIGTGNPETMGTLYFDEDAHRRFIVINVAGCSKGWDHATTYLRGNMLQLWAEGLHWYRSGYRAKLPEELQWWRKEAIKAHMERDELFIEKLRDLEDECRRNVLHYDPDMGFSVPEIGRATGLYKEEAGGKGDRTFMRRMGIALKQDHWIARRVAVQDRRDWRWFLPLRDPPKED